VEASNSINVVDYVQLLDIVLIQAYRLASLNFVNLLPIVSSRSPNLLSFEPFA
jgi:hypothetical protein